MFKRTNVKVLGILENMTSFTSDDGVEHFIFGKDGGKKIANKFNIKLIGQIPLNTELRISCDVGIPYMQDNKKDKISEIFTNIANEIIKEIN
jgi:ATP-binding protein involved in chromosome partitioning